LTIQVLFQLSKLMGIAATKFAMETSWFFITKNYQECTHDWKGLAQLFL
jgi:hypothetical protein